jgi:inner membrane protein
MDTISQAALGVFTTDTLCRRTLGPKNVAIGMAAGILPDLDVIVPQLVELAGGNFYLAYLQTHRTWSHSLVTAPILAAVLALLFSRLRPFRQLRFLPIFIAALLSAVTHILLDWCTSYGIELFWPLSRHRFALFWVPEIDLFFLPALIVLLLIIVTMNYRKRSSGNLSWMGLAAFAAYIAFGAFMHHQVWERFESSTMHNGGAAATVHREVFPHLGSLLVWRGIEVSETRMKISRYNFLQPEPSAIFESENHLYEAPDWLRGGPLYSVMDHATSGFLWVERDSASEKQQHFLLHDVRFAISPMDASGLITIAATRDSGGSVNYAVKSWFLGKTFSRRQSYKQATAQLWKNIFTPNPDNP